MKNDVFNSAEVSRRFIQIRTQLGLTQEELSKKLGVSSQSIKNYEKAGSENPKTYDSGSRINAIAGMKIETLHKMAKLSNVSADYLLGLTDDPAFQKSAVDELHRSEEVV